MSKKKLILILIISSFLISGIWCQYGDDEYCWDNCVCSDDCWDAIDDCYDVTCSASYNTFYNEMENNLNYDFTKLIDYQICFIPCYYGKSNSEVYDFSACYDKCSGITSINILFKTCYSDMLAFIGDFRDLVIVDTNICGTTCNDITMVDDGYGYIDFSDYYDLYDCYDCIDLNTGVYEGATSYGDFVTCIENEGYILDSYWFVYSFIYGYDVTSSVYTYQDDYYDDDYYDKCYDSCTCDDACWAYYDSCKETICATEKGVFQSEIEASSFSVDTLIDFNLCLVPCYDGVDVNGGNPPLYDYSKCIEGCYGSQAVEITYESCYTEIQDYILDFKTQIIQDLCSSSCLNIDAVYDEITRELEGEVWEYLYDCYDCIYNEIDDFIQSSDPATVLTDCVQNFNYTVDLYYLYYSAMEGYQFEWSIYESYYYDYSEDYYDYSCYENCECDDECWESQWSCYDSECEKEYLDYYNEYDNENQISMSKLFDYEICFIQCYYDPLKKKLQAYNLCNSKCSGTADIDQLFYSTCLEEVIAYFQAFNNEVIKTYCLDTCENIPLTYEFENDFENTFLGCFDCIDTNWANFENSKAVNDLYSCIEANGYSGDANQIAKAFMMGGGQVQNIDLKDTVKKDATSSSSYLTPIIFIIFLLQIIIQFI